jgi:hypothetical protein
MLEYPFASHFPWGSLVAPLTANIVPVAQDGLPSSSDVRMKRGRFTALSLKGWNLLQRYMPGVVGFELCGI